MLKKVVLGCGLVIIECGLWCAGRDRVTIMLLLLVSGGRQREQFRATKNLCLGIYVRIGSDQVQVRRSIPRLHVSIRAVEGGCGGIRFSASSLGRCW